MPAASSTQRVILIQRDDDGFAVTFVPPLEAFSPIRFAAQRAGIDLGTTFGHYRAARLSAKALAILAKSSGDPRAIQDWTVEGRRARVIELLDQLSPPRDQTR